VTTAAVNSALHRARALDEVVGRRLVVVGEDARGLGDHRGHAVAGGDEVVTQRPGRGRPDGLGQLEDVPRQVGQPRRGLGDALEHEARGVVAGAVHARGHDDPSTDLALGLVGALLGLQQRVGDGLGVRSPEAGAHREVEDVPAVGEHAGEALLDVGEAIVGAAQPLEHDQASLYRSNRMPTNGMT
jgi:hypothetical protein